MRKNKYFSSVLIASLLLNVTSVGAAQVTTVTQPDTASMAVNVSVQSSFKVTIPKKVVLNKNENGIYESNYSVTVSDSDIRTNQDLTISVPNKVEFERADTQDKVNLVQTCSGDGVSTVSNNILIKTQSDNQYTFTIAESGDLKAGSWSGFTGFTISLVDR